MQVKKINDKSLWFYEFLLVFNSANQNDACVNLTTVVISLKLAFYVYENELYNCTTLALRHYYIRRFKISNLSENLNSSDWSISQLIRWAQTNAPLLTHLFVSWFFIKLFLINEYVHMVRSGIHRRLLHFDLLAPRVWYP